MMRSKNQQQGFSLFMVMIIMLVIALLVVVASQSASTEMRVSTNEADRKFAMSLAETGLRNAEDTIRQMTSEANKDIDKLFRYDCSGTKSTIVAWKRTFGGSSVFDNNGATSYPLNDSGDQKEGTVRYVIEFLGERNDSSTGALGRYFRVTARAKGENPNTTVTLQSYVEANSI
ncbi:pilus assembly PilX family protein [Simonsiella muelleri]|uniref:pilus assembly PilX family protein n=1 Tax=Simonsiella muelleri TaxID=72 RepID=UPI0023F3715E|nr:PilX N-terminal domain-containing pilus assembly protein [Simonsiella muelleri]